MTPKQLEAIRRHGEALLELFPNATEQDPVKLCKKLRRIERKAQRHFAMMCSHEWYVTAHTDADGDDTEKPKLYLAVERILGPEGMARVWLNSDPRGYALKVYLRDGERLYTDMGGYGIVAPEIGPDGL